MIGCSVLFRAAAAEQLADGEVSRGAGAAGGARVAGQRAPGRAQQQAARRCLGRAVVPGRRAQEQ